MTAKLTTSYGQHGQRVYPNSQLVFTANYTVSDVLTDVSTITFRWKIGKYGAETTVTPTHTGTGTYSATVVPGSAGNLYGRWDTDGTYDVVTEPVINVKESSFTQ